MELERLYDIIMNNQQIIIKNQEDIAKLGEEVKKTNKCLEKMGEHINKMNERMDRIEERMDKIEERMDKIEERMDRIEERMDNMDKKIEDFKKEMYAKFDENIVETAKCINIMGESIANMIQNELKDHEQRICKLERICFSKGTICINEEPMEYNIKMEDDDSSDLDA